MRTFAELRGFVRQTFARTFDDAPLVKAHVPVPGGRGEEIVGFAVITYGEQPCVLLMVDICAESALGPSRALELNRDLGPASLVPLCGRYLLRQVMPLDAMVAPLVQWSCAYLAQQAQRVRDGLARGTCDAAFYAQFLD